MITADTPNLWEIRNETSHAVAVAVIVKALIHLARLVNIKVEDNLNDVQIGEIANDVIEEYGYLKVEEVKYIFKQALRSKQIYGRLDYNVVMSWIEEYDTQRTEACIDISDQNETQQANEPPDQSEQAISLDEYISQLEVLADNGDMDAQKRLGTALNVQQLHGDLTTRNNRRQKEIEFKQFYYNNYLKNKR